LKKVSGKGEVEPHDGKKPFAITYSDSYLIRLGGLEKLHPFDTHKYRRIHEGLVRDGLADPRTTHAPEPLSEDDLLRVHTRRYLDGLKSAAGVSEALEFPQIANLPQSVLADAVVTPHRTASGGTLLAARLAASGFPVSVNLGGGYHHAMPDHGEGFCLFADVPIAIRHLQAEGKIRRALVVDLDVHQGNGTAVIFSDDERVFTFSMHQRDIYPVPKALGDLDVEIEAGTGDSEYLGLLSEHLPETFRRSDPEIIFFLAGCDVLAGDPLAGLSLTERGVVERDWTVVDSCIQRNLPVVMTLAGGYSKDSWRVQHHSLRSLLRRL
jgi:histone deacetylase 11